MSLSIRNIVLSFILIMLAFPVTAQAQTKRLRFSVVAFFTAKNDAAHISFVHEANRWFPQIAAKHHFVYDSTNNWSNLNTTFLANYDVVLFFRHKTRRLYAKSSL